MPFSTRLLYSKHFIPSRSVGLQITFNFSLFSFAFNFFQWMSIHYYNNMIMFVPFLHLSEPCTCLVNFSLFFHEWKFRTIKTVEACLRSPSLLRNHFVHRVYHTAFRFPTISCAHLSLTPPTPNVCSSGEDPSFLHICTSNIDLPLYLKYDGESINTCWMNRCIFPLNI